MENVHIEPHSALVLSCANACGLLLSRLDTMLQISVIVLTGKSCGMLADRKVRLAVPTVVLGSSRAASAARGTVICGYRDSSAIKPGLEKMLSAIWKVAWFGSAAM